MPKKRPLKESREIMISILRRKPLRHSEFKEKAKSKGISHSTFSMVLKKEEKKKREEQLILKFKRGSISYYYLQGSVQDLWDLISQQQEYQSAVGRDKFERWKNHSELIKRTLSTLKEQIPDVSLELGQRFILFPIEKENEGVPFDHLFVHDELGLDFRDRFENLKSKIVRFEEEKNVLFNKLEKTIESHFSHTAVKIEVDAGFVKAVFKMLIMPDWFYNYDSLREKHLTFEDGFYRIPEEGVLLEGWLRYRNQPNESLDSTINELKNIILDEINGSEYQIRAQAVIEEKKTILEDVRSFKVLLERLLIGPFKPCQLIL